VQIRFSVASFHTVPSYSEQLVGSTVRVVVVVVVLLGRPFVCCELRERWPGGNSLRNEVCFLCCLLSYDCTGWSNRNE